eukprot:m.137718 g.137718  ORF g.137718 m.137718 type:complete len:790 (-) comp16609_c2_seq5:719-3088(-)
MLRLIKTPLLGAKSVAPEEILLRRDGATVFGRDPNRVDVVIDSKNPCTISRNHATIKSDGDSFILTVDGINGAFVNGYKVKQQTRLVIGDTICFGGAPKELKYDLHVPEPRSELQYKLETAPPLAVSADSSAAAASAADDPAAATVDAADFDSVPKAARSKLLEDMEEEFICMICQQLLVSAHNLPCSHCFCEDCLNRWLQKRNNTCPTCRKLIDGKPIPVKAIDNAVEKIAKERLSAEDLAERDERVKALNQQRRAKDADSSHSSKRAKLDGSGDGAPALARRESRSRSAAAASAKPDTATAAGATRATRSGKALAGASSTRAEAAAAAKRQKAENGKKKGAAASAGTKRGAKAVATRTRTRAGASRRRGADADTEDDTDSEDDDEEEESGSDDDDSEYEEESEDSEEDDEEESEDDSDDDEFNPHRGEGLPHVMQGSKRRSAAGSALPAGKVATPILVSTATSQSLRPRLVAPALSPGAAGVAGAAGAVAGAAATTPVYSPGGIRPVGRPSLAAVRAASATTLVRPPVAPVRPNGVAVVGSPGTAMAASPSVAGGVRPVITGTTGRVRPAVAPVFAPGVRPVVANGANAGVGTVAGAGAVVGAGAVAATTGAATGNPAVPIVRTTSRPIGRPSNFALAARAPGANLALRAPVRPVINTLTAMGPRGPERAAVFRIRPNTPIEIPPTQILPAKPVPVSLAPSGLYSSRRGGEVFELEYSPTNRTPCKQCEKFIKEGDLRWVVDHEDQSRGEELRYFHYTCAHPSFSWSKRVSHLKPEDQTIVKERFMF